MTTISLFQAKMFKKIKTWEWYRLTGKTCIHGLLPRVCSLPKSSMTDPTNLHRSSFIILQPHQGVVTVNDDQQPATDLLTASGRFGGRREEAISWCIESPGLRVCPLSPIFWLVN